MEARGSPKNIMNAKKFKEERIEREQKEGTTVDVRAKKKKKEEEVNEGGE